TSHGHVPSSVQLQRMEQSRCLQLSKWCENQLVAKKRTLTLSRERPMCIISALQADLRIHFRGTAWQMTSYKLVSQISTSRKIFQFGHFIHTDIWPQILMGTGVAI